MGKGDMKGGYGSHMGGRMEKGTGKNPKGGGMSAKNQKREDYDNGGSGGSFQAGFKNKNDHPWGK